MSDFEVTKKVFDDLVNEFPEVQRKGKTSPYTSMNGNMFSIVGKNGELGIRLSKEDHEAYVSEFGATQLIMHNCNMNGYISVPEKYLGDAEFLHDLFEKSIKNAKALKPKPTTKKK